MAGRLHNKVCIITGSSGIGAATAETAHSEGARLFITSDSQDTLAELTRKLGAPESCGFLRADLSHAACAEEVVGRCLERFGRIDALFNVAGISGRSIGDGPVHECTDEGWEMTMSTNTRSVFLLCRAAIRRMLLQPRTGTGEPGGVILNMASVLAFSPEPRFFATHAYAASKGAIVSLSKAMAAYYAPHGIRVNVLAPGLVRTPMSRRAQEDPQILEFMKTKQPLAANLIDPVEVARAAVFLLSDESRSITGTVMTIDAGWSVGG